MEILISIDGITRKYQGDYEELMANDWDRLVSNMIDDCNDYSKEPNGAEVFDIRTIPGFAEVQEALDKLAIRK